MKERFSPAQFKTVITLLALLLGVKLVWFVVETVWLPASGVNYVEEKGGNALYYNVKITPNEAPVPVQQTVKPVENAGSIKDIELLGIYSASDSTVVTVLYKKKTKVLGKGEEINGFVLEGAEKRAAVFSKSGKRYTLELLKPKKSTGKSTFSIATPEPTPSKAEEKDRPEGEIVTEGDRILVDKSLVTYYADNMDDILNDVGFAPEEDKGSLGGFRVSFLKKGSHFEQLGLKRGDVITSINGQEIRSYNDAVEVYKNIKNLDGLNLTIIRGKKEMELEYEIN